MKLIIYTLAVILSLSSCGSGDSTKKNNETQEISSNEFLKGKKLYEARCANCHKADGKGMGNLYPPIANSDYLSNKEKIICSIKNGANEEIMVNGKKYKMPMPAQADLNEVEISDIMNYIYNSWGNQLGPVSLKEVETALSNCNK